MPDRHTTYRLTLTPATEAALLRLKECGENKQLLSRCALWCSMLPDHAVHGRRRRLPISHGCANCQHAKVKAFFKGERGRQKRLPNA